MHTPPTGQGEEFIVKIDLNIDLFLTHTYHNASEDIDLTTGVLLQSSGHYSLAMYEPTELKYSSKNLEGE